MTEDEFEQLTLRFGEDIAAWPAPYRQQALRLSTGKRDFPSDQDDALDRLVLEAALLDADERRLASQVLARIDDAHSRTFGSLLSGVLLKPAAMAACSALLFTVLAMGGYQLAASQGDPFDAQLLALATGSSLGTDFLDPSPDDGTENAL